MTQLPAWTPENLQFILDRLANDSTDTGGRQLKIRFGTSSVTYTASAVTAEKTIAHGLNGVPVFVTAFMRAPLADSTVLYESTASDSTNIYITGRQSAGLATTSTQNIYWIAYG